MLFRFINLVDPAHLHQFYHGQKMFHLNRDYVLFVGFFLFVVFLPNELFLVRRWLDNRVLTRRNYEFLS